MKHVVFLHYSLDVIEYGFSEKCALPSVKKKKKLICVCVGVQEEEEVLSVLICEEEEVDLCVCVCSSDLLNFEDLI